MYVFLNSFSFEDPSPNCQATEIQDSLSSLATTIKRVQDLDSDVIVAKDLSSKVINGAQLRVYINSMHDKEQKSILFRKFDNVLPFCSTEYSDYYDDKFVDENCYAGGKDDILDTFLACALHLEAYVLTVDKICNRAHFKTTPILIKCDDDQEYCLNNILLSSIDVLIDDLMAKKSEDIANWDEYSTSLIDNFNHVCMTKDCLDNIKKHASFNSQSGRGIRERIDKLNTFIKESGGNPSSVNYKDIGEHYNEESDTKLRKKKKYLKFRNIDGEKQLMSWHARVGSFRMYFYFDDEQIYITSFVPKIPDP